MRAAPRAAISSGGAETPFFTHEEDPRFLQCEHHPGGYFVIARSYEMLVKLVVQLLYISTLFSCSAYVLNKPPRSKLVCTIDDNTDSKIFDTASVSNAQRQ
mmetsp:Transcript_31859/g.44413  ORF Transcript_31859/g.44413 Transcript_31859/m.44413 type:complete len:101 (+) Transcript_31859:267-569(+)